MPYGEPRESLRSTALARLLGGIGEELAAGANQYRAGTIQEMMAQSAAERRRREEMIAGTMKQVGETDATPEEYAAAQRLMNELPERQRGLASLASWDTERQANRLPVSSAEAMTMRDQTPPAPGGQESWSATAQRSRTNPLSDLLNARPSIPPEAAKDPEALGRVDETQMAQAAMKMPRREDPRIKIAGLKAIQDRARIKSYEDKALDAYFGQLDDEEESMVGPPGVMQPSRIEGLTPEQKARYDWVIKEKQLVLEEKGRRTMGGKRPTAASPAASPAAPPKAEYNPYTTEETKKTGKASPGGR
mgnify:CR=1 FL=1